MARPEAPPPPAGADRRAHGVRRALTWIIDPATGALTVEGLRAEEAAALGGDLLPQPQTVNCARPVTRDAWVPTASPAAGAPALGDGEAGGGRRDGSRIPLRVARIFHGSVVDGPGRRSVVQVQGCPIRCPACYVPHTHDPAGGVALPVGAVAAAALDPAGAPRDGVTVSGGEPFAQPDGLAALLRALRREDVHTVVYSGSTLEALRRRPEPAVAEALRLTDVLVDGPFVAALAGDAGEWRGSRNQRVIARPGDGPAPVRPRICPPAPRPIPKEVTRMADTEPAADAIGPSHPLPPPPRRRGALAGQGPVLHHRRVRPGAARPRADVEPVVRATLTWAADSAGAPAYDVSVVATYLRRVGPDVVALTELRHYAGVAWIVSGGRRPPAR